MSKMNKVIRITAVLGLLLAVVFSTGCATTHDAVKYRNLDVQTKQSDTIFLEPAAPSNKILYMDVRNTSDKVLNVEHRIRVILQSVGYQITENPYEANYMLQANILQVGKSEKGDNPWGALESGYGGALFGGALAGMNSGSYRSLGRNSAAGAAVGMLAGTLFDAMVNTIDYTMITDLRIRERPKKHESVSQEQFNTAKSGSRSSIQQHVTGQAPAAEQWKIYETRIISLARKTNLKFDDAVGELENGLVRVISGIF
jgi:hypothetical protein